MSSRERLLATVVFFGCLFSCLAGAVRADPVVHVARGSTWKYLRGSAEASSPADLWRAPSFPDDAWESGRAPLGYGEPGLIVTDITGVQGVANCVFFRQEFTLADPSTVQALDLNVNFDDGIVVWVNGAEVARLNMPGVPGDSVAVGGFALANHEQGTYENHQLPPPGGYLVSGTNVIAVQVFNNQVNSSDLVLDLDLTDPFGPDGSPPAIAALVPAAGATVRSLSRIEVTFDEDVLGVQAADLLIGGTPAAAVTGTSPGPFTFSFPEPALGAVAVAWAAGHGITDQADPPNPFAGGGWSYTLDPDAPPGDLAINEILASNRSGILDEDGERVDFIEVVNRGSEAVDLNGWGLSDEEDDPGKWTFPARVLAPGEHVVVFASGKDRKPAAGNLHASFQLNADGDFVGLFTAESPRQAVSALGPEYPAQRADISYGADGGGGFSYFDPPTPGAPNGSAAVFAGAVADPSFAPRRGLYDDPVDVEIFTPTPDAEIRYTLDGSEPTPASGTLYTGPFTVEGTGSRAVVSVRAVAYRAGYLPSRVMTHTYIFPEDVLTQPASPAGFPSAWGSAPAVDYGMDPEVVNDPAYTARVREGLRDLPSLSVVMATADMFGASGIYSNPLGEGVAWERPASAELILPDGRQGFQIDCGIRIQGGASREPPKSPKHSVRLLFKGDYGATKLRYPIFPDSRVDTFDTLTFRANFNNSWIHWDATQRGRGQLIHDQWGRDTQLAMGQVSSHGLFVNLYINGLYWGVYNPVERPSASFAAEHFGGEKEEYDSLNSAVAVDGNTTAWSQLMALANSGLVNDPQYQQVKALVDLEAFADYMIINLFGSNVDWPHHNWYGVRKREAGAKWYFIGWDTERILEGVNDNRTSVNNPDSPGVIFSSLRSNAEFRRLFGDRVHRHFFNSGALTPQAVEARWMARAAEIDNAVACESARWGDYRRDVHPFSSGPYLFYRRDDAWIAEQTRLRNTYFPQRSNVVVNQFRAISLYPNVGAPILSQHGGRIEAGFMLSMTLPAGTSGTIYYTTDGSDPRVEGTGAVAPTAAQYAGSLVLNDFTLVKARTRSGADWSALSDAAFTLSNPADGLRVSEIMYDPEGGSAYEFIELENTGPFTLGLNGLYFEDGITFVFDPEAAIAPGAFLVLVADAPAFASRYPEVDIAGVYTGNLDNGGEKVTLKDFSDATVLSVEYRDDGFWPIAADGFGFSLVSTSAAGDPDDPLNWRASAGLHGSPGSADPDPAHGGIVVNEVLTRSAAPFEDAIELLNASSRTMDVGGWYLSDSRADAASLKKYRIPLGTSLAPGEYAVFYESQFDPSLGVFPSFELAAAGGSVYLASAFANGVLSGHITGHEFAGAEAGDSFGIHATSRGFELTALAATTFGADSPATVAEFRTGEGEANAAPRVGPVVIHEIQYHPAAGDIEFIELRNLTGAPVALHDAASGRGWEVSGVRNAEDTGSYAFPAGTVVPANGYLLLVENEPDSFRFTYGVPAAVPVLGPYAGGIDNSGERLKLEKPFGSDAVITIDEVRFNDRAPWATAADGEGPSLERLRPADFGNDPINWDAALVVGGTPGAANSVSGAGVNQRPIASFTVTPEPEPLRVVVDAAASNDVDGSIVSWEWDFGDATSGSGESLLHVFPAAGTYTVRLTVRDDDGASGSAQRSVTVSGPDPGGRQIPGDSNQDGALEVSDAISFLHRLFPAGAPVALPCDGAALDQGANRELFDANDDTRVDLGDLTHLLNYLFLSGPRHVLGASCIPIPGCPTACAP
jgi:hypothetical protein